MTEDYRPTLGDATVTMRTWPAYERRWATVFPPIDDTVARELVARLGRQDAPVVAQMGMGEWATAPVAAGGGF